MGDVIDGEKNNNPFNECYSVKDHKPCIKTASNVMQLNPLFNKDHFDVQCGNLSICINP